MGDSSGDSSPHWFQYGHFDPRAVESEEGLEPLEERSYEVVRLPTNAHHDRTDRTGDCATDVDCLSLLISALSPSRAFPNAQSVVAVFRRAVILDDAPSLPPVLRGQQQFDIPSANSSYRSLLHQKIQKLASPHTISQPTIISTESIESSAPYLYQTRVEIGARCGRGIGVFGPAMQSKQKSKDAACRVVLRQLEILAMFPDFNFKSENSPKLRSAEQLFAPQQSEENRTPVVDRRHVVESRHSQYVTDRSALCQFPCGNGKDTVSSLLRSAKRNCTGDSVAASYQTSDTPVANNIDTSCATMHTNVQVIDLNDEKQYTSSTYRGFISGAYAPPTPPTRAGQDFTPNYGPDTPTGKQDNNYLKHTFGVPRYVPTFSPTRTAVNSVVEDFELSDDDGANDRPQEVCHGVRTLAAMLGIQRGKVCERLRLCGLKVKPRQTSNEVFQLAGMHAEWPVASEVDGFVATLVVRVCGLELRGHVGRSKKDALSLAAGEFLRQLQVATSTNGSP